jgi:hypothetical protein
MPGYSFSVQACRPHAAVGNLATSKRRQKPYAEQSEIKLHMFNTAYVAAADCFCITNEHADQILATADKPVSHLQKG